MTPTGELTERVQVQREIVPATRDSLNQKPKSSDDAAWETVATVWAKVRTAKAKGTVEGAGAVALKHKFDVVMRRNNLKLTPRYRILWPDTWQLRTRVLHIEAVGESSDEWDFELECIELPPRGEAHP